MKISNAQTATTMGTLYLVATPIGNLEDITYRAVRILKEADAVYCEDTRRTLVLLKHYGIERKQGIDSFHDHSSPRLLEKIKGHLKAGQSVAYATDGGMPVVSDPGFVLVRAAHQIGAPVAVLPGPSAAVTLFAASGLPSPKYLFHGFFPRTRGEVERTVEVVRSLSVVHIFYEAPGRILTSLEILNRNMPDTAAVVGRELTKVHEEVARGTVTEIFETLSAREKVKGECVIAVMGGNRATLTGVEKGQMRASQDGDLEPVLGQDGLEEKPQVFELTAQHKEEIAVLIKSGVSSKDAAKQLAKKFGAPRRVIYEFIIRHLT